MTGTITGLRATLSLVLQRGLWTIVAALAVGAIAFAVGAVRDDIYESTAKIAFVDETRFDYVDAERDRLVGIANSEAGRAITQTAGVREVDYVRPSREEFLDISVRANDPNTASRVANELADLIVAGDLQFQLDPINAELDARRASADAMNSSIAALETEIDTQTKREAFAEANRFADDAASLERLTIELRDAQDALFLAIRERNALLSTQAENSEIIAQLEIEKAAAPERIRVVIPAVEPEDVVPPSPLQLALLAAAAAATIVVAGQLLWAPVRAQSNS